MRQDFLPSPENDPAPGEARTYPVRVRVLTGGGLAALVLAMGLAVLMAQDPAAGGIQPIRGRFGRQDSPVSSVAFGRDGRSVAVGRCDGFLEIQEPGRGRARHLLDGTGRAVRSVAFSPDGLTLAAAGPGPDVTLWDVATGEPRATMAGHSAQVSSVAFSPDGESLASASVDGRIKLWGLAGFEELRSMAGHTDEVRGLTFSADGKTLVSGSFDGMIRLWDPATGRERSSFRGDEKPRRVYTLAFSPDGRLLAFGLGATTDGDKGVIVLRDLAARRETLRTPGESCYFTLAFAPDGRTLATGGGDTVVKLWDVETGRERGLLVGHEGFIESLAFSPDGRSLVTGGRDNLVGHFDLATHDARPAHRL